MNQLIEVLQNSERDQSKLLKSAAWADHMIRGTYSNSIVCDSSPPPLTDGGGIVEVRPSPRDAVDEHASYSNEVGILN